MLSLLYSSDGWVQIPSVVFTELCPKISERAFGSKSFSMHRVINVCLSAWKFISDTPLYFRLFLNVYVNALGSVNRSFPVSRNAFSVLGLMYFNFFIKKPGSGIVRFVEGVFGSVIIIFVFLPDSPLIAGIRCNVAVILIISFIRSIFSLRFDIFTLP